MGNPAIYDKDNLNDLFPNVENKVIDLGLDRIKACLQDMGNPCHSIPAIQIVGTNGKGSIASFLQSCLKEAGISAGVTTSPHLVSWTERIQTNGNSISSEELRKRIEALKPIAKRNKLSPFEILIAVAFDHFNSKNVELLVLEAGLGGRLDATTAHPKRPIIAIASIGLDHCEYLGESLEDIAKEKAAVINQGSIVISSRQDPKVEKVLESITTKQEANLIWVPPLTKQWELGLAGTIQRENAAVAKGVLEALKLLDWEIEESTIRRGLALAKWPARMQSANWNKLPLIIDVAHNPPSASQLAEERKKWANQVKGVHWILGIQVNKAGPGMLRNLIDPRDHAWIVPIPNHLSWTKASLVKTCPELSSQLFQANNVEEVLLTLLSKDKWPKPPPVIAGSIYLIGDLLSKKLIETN